MVQKNMSINYKLDPCLYLSNPELNWDSMLKMTVAALQILAWISMLERSMRGEVCYLVQRYTKAKDEEMKLIKLIDQANLDTYIHICVYI